MGINQTIRFLAASLVAALLLAGLAGTPAIAQEKAKAEKGKSVTTVLAENDKVRVWETRYKPGDQNTAPPSSATRVLRVLKGGTLLWTYADGKTEKVVWKAGEVKILTPGPQFTSKNVGKSEIVLYVVMLK
jgi:mannose-6-phosphate isomerase-like protein (cupin superfamily)